MFGAISTAFFETFLAIFLAVSLFALGKKTYRHLLERRPRGPFGKKLLAALIGVVFVAIFVLVVAVVEWTTGLSLL